MIDTMSHRSTNSDYDIDAPLFKTHTSDRIIDFILLNPAAAGEHVPNSGFILGTSAEEYDWRKNPVPSGYASDHYPFAIDLVPSEGMGSTVTAEPWPVSSFVEVKNKKQTEPSKTIPIEGATFIASKRSKVFHDASCGNAKRIKDSNKLGFESFDDASNSDRKPAGCCKPTK